MVSLLIAALLVVLGFSTGSVWAHVTTDTPSFTEWHWRPDVVIVVTLLSTAYVAGWRRLRKRNSYRKEVATLGLSHFYGNDLSRAPLSYRRFGLVSFHLHMTPHELLMMVAAPLLLLAEPLPVFLWGIPQRLRYRLGPSSPKMPWFAAHSR